MVTEQEEFIQLVEFSGDLLAIDPGSAESGCVLVAYDPDQPEILAAGTYPNGLVLRALREAGEDLLCLVEDFVASGQPQGLHTTKTPEQIGRFREALEGRGVELHRMKRSDVLRYLGVVRQKGKTTDSLVSLNLRERYGEKGTKKAPGLLYGLAGHSWQAMGLAVAWMIKEDTERRRLSA